MPDSEYRDGRKDLLRTSGGTHRELRGGRSVSVFRCTYGAHARMRCGGGRVERTNTLIDIEDVVESTRKKDGGGRRDRPVERRRR